MWNIKVFGGDHGIINKSLQYHIHGTGDISSDSLKSTFVMIRKKTKATICEVHKTISLVVSRVLKALMWVIYNKINLKNSREIYRIPNLGFIYLCKSLCFHISRRFWKYILPPNKAQQTRWYKEHWKMVKTPVSLLQ